MADSLSFPAYSAVRTRVGEGVMAGVAGRRVTGMGSSSFCGVPRAARASATSILAVSCVRLHSEGHSTHSSVPVHPVVEAKAVWESYDFIPTHEEYKTFK